MTKDNKTRMYPEEIIVLNEYHDQAYLNKKKMELRDNGCCFNCCTRYYLALNHIEYTDNGETALCPKCKTDTMIPGGGSSLEFLIAMKDYWVLGKDIEQIIPWCKLP